jgi:hypothetical protein
MNSLINSKYNWISKTKETLGIKHAIEKSDKTADINDLAYSDYILKEKISQVKIKNSNKIEDDKGPWIIVRFIAR